MALVTYLDNRAYGAITACHKLERKRIRDRRRKASQKLLQARTAEAQAVNLATDVATLLAWLRFDVLALAGPSYADRCAGRASFWPACKAAPPSQTMASGAKPCGTRSSK